MICSFTQTYFNNRLDLLKYQMMDDNLVEFKNRLDLNLYSFHNSSDKTVDEFLKINRLKNLMVLRYNNVSYTECIIDSLKIIKDFDYVFFIQDDGLSTGRIDYDKLLSHLHPNIFVSLGFRTRDFSMKPIETDGIFSVYTCRNFFDEGFLSIDDSPYISDTKNMMSFYDEDWKKQQNVWTAEMYLSDKMKDSGFMKRVMDKRSFVNINTKGPTSIYSSFRSMVTGRGAKRFLKHKFKTLT